MIKIKIKFFAKLKEDIGHESLSISLENPTKVIDVIKMTKRVSGKEINYKIVERRAGDPAELYASSDLAYNTLNWKPTCSDLKSLIESTWNVYNK